MKKHLMAAMLAASIPVSAVAENATVAESDVPQAEKEVESVDTGWFSKQWEHMKQLCNTHLFCDNSQPVADEPAQPEVVASDEAVAEPEPVQPTEDVQSEEG
jgi:hypothetical protein